MKLFNKYITSFALAAAVAMGFASCQDDIDAPAVDVPVASLQPNISILDLKTRFWNDATNYADSIYDPNDPDARFIISGRVISSDEESNVFKSLVIQDETAAIAFSLNSYSLYLKYRVGQELVVDLTGLHIGKYNGYQQIGRPEWYAQGNAYEVTFMSPELFAQHTQYNGLPKPAEIDTLVIPSFSAISTNPENLIKYQSQLVRFQNVHFEEGGKALFSEYHSSGVNRTLVDQSGLTLTVRTSGYSTFWNNTLPEGNLDVVGILSYYGTTGWQFILIDEKGCIKVGDRPGEKDKPYTVEQAISLENDGTVAEGWVKGYIVGAVAPEVENVASNSDIEWQSPTVLDNTLVIAPSADCADYSKCLVIFLPSDSPLREYGGLKSNPANLGKEILLKGRFEKYLGTWGITGNTGKADEFEIDGVTIETGEIPAGDGQEATPYNVAQVIAKNPSSTQNATESGVWVKGYIVGYMPTEPTTVLSGTVFGAEGAVATNLVIGPTADCTDYTKCVGVQLPSAMRGTLALSSNPGNLGKTLAIKGDLMKYCQGPGVKNLTANVLGGGGSEPEPPTPSEAVSSLDATFESGAIPSGWSNVTVSGDKTWYVTTFDNNYYAAMTGYKGTQPPFDQWLISPAVDMSKVSDKKLSFQSQVNGYGSTTTQFNVYVLTSADPTTATKTELSFNKAQAPESGYSGFVASGDIDLSKFSGTIYIGFQYYATSDANYATWCVDDIKLNAGSTTKPDDPKPDDPVNPPVEPSGDGVTITPAQLTVPGESSVEGYTITIDKAAGATAPMVHAGTGALRIYARNTLSISSSVKIAKIEFKINGSNRYRYTDAIPSTGEISPAQAQGDTSFTWVGDSSDVTFTVGSGATHGSDGEAKPGQLHIDSITIYPAK